MDGPRVALVLATSAGGVGRHVRSLADGLRARGAKVVVLGPASSDALFGFTESGAGFAPVEIADRPHPVGDVRAVARIRRLTQDADVVHAHGLRAGGLAALARVRTVPGPLRLGTAGPPLVVTLHNASIAGGLTGAAYATLERVVARGAAEVLAVSPDLEERMRSLGARSVGLALVPAPPLPPSDDPAASKRIRAELAAGDRPLILTVARLAEQKGLPTLLDAAAGWARLDPRPLVVIAGDGPLEAELRDRIAAEHLPVRLLGRRTDVADLLAAADVAVVPSVWEGQPLIVQEVLRAGRPLVATRVGGVPGMVGEAALLVPSGDADELEGAVRRVLDDPALADRLASAAVERASRLPADDDATDQLLAVYTRVTRATL
ncbi:glycosyltransferase family 4 protein [Actinoallomurus purpureus]|uniref:glycosyltransferase family 4 protein n=1 Tax=Actinoallomurus purpureus TaxID=478114 RepID=UPI00209292DB|nr:glycosyltransferase family 4 protein [Actinoallomurus purpureus]MCO6007951.1 glycosyltransferase family 4 protein [Actinoallomurus purpureus]